MRALLILAVGWLAIGGAAQARTLGQLRFTPCEVVEVSGNGVARAECARFAVAEAPQQPAGRSIELAVTLFPARGASVQPDIVTLLAGGPGQSAADAYFQVQAALEPLRADRHLLLLDQRGTGQSNRLACPVPDWKSARQPGAEELRGMAADCLNSYAGRADPRWYTTSAAVRDLEALRSAVGAPQWNLIGGSYGTRVALEYLRRHPQRVRSAVLDGVVPPELALLQDHARNLDGALRLLSARCAAEAACAARFGDPFQTMRELQQRLRGRPEAATYLHPRTHEPRQERLTAPLLQAFIRLFSYSPEALSVLPLLVDEAAKGRPQTLMAQIESIAERIENQLAHGMELSVACTEDAPFLQRRSEDAATLLGGEGIQQMQAQCEAWPKGELPADFKRPVTSDRPVLLLSGEYDPVTPPRYGQQVLKHLSRGRHLVAPGAGHIALLRGCMPRLVRQFIDNADAAGLETSCLALMKPAPLFLGYEGPAP